MFKIKNNEKNKSAVILNPERSEWVSRSHVTSVESVINDGAKTKPHHALRRSLRALAYGSTLKMTEKALSFLRLRGASGAQGISATASCREAHKHRFLFNSWILRLRLRMTIPALALLFTFATTAESWADESATTAEDTTQTQETQKLLTKEGDCGAGCKYKITEDNGKRNLYVYNKPNYTGVANIASYAFASSYDYDGKNYNYYDNAKFDKIIIDGNFGTIGSGAFTAQGATEVVFNGNIKNIGYGAFEFNNFTSVDLPEGLQKIEGEAFYYNSISSIVIPDSVTSIGNYAFASTQRVEEVQITDTLDSLGKSYPFNPSYNLGHIVCKGDVEKCQSLVTEYNNGEATTTPVDISGKVTGVDKDHCTGDKYFWNGTSCSRKESYCDKDMYYTGSECIMRPTDGTDITCDYDISGYVKVGNNCYSPEVTYAKKHYTPAEANQWLHDGNDNFVILTFKK